MVPQIKISVELVVRIQVVITRITNKSKCVQKYQTDCIIKGRNGKGLGCFRHPLRDYSSW